MANEWTSERVLEALRAAVDATSMAHACKVAFGDAQCVAAYSAWRRTKADEASAHWFAPGLHITTTSLVAMAEALNEAGPTKELDGPAKAWAPQIGDVVRSKLPEDNGGHMDVVSVSNGIYYCRAGGYSAGYPLRNIEPVPLNPLVANITTARPGVVGDAHDLVACVRCGSTAGSRCPTTDIVTCSGCGDEGLVMSTPAPKPAPVDPYERHAVKQLLVAAGYAQQVETTVAGATSRARAMLDRLRRCVADAEAGLAEDKARIADLERALAECGGVAK